MLAIFEFAEKSNPQINKNEIIEPILINFFNDFYKATRKKIESEYDNSKKINFIEVSLKLMDKNLEVTVVPNHDRHTLLIFSSKFDKPFKSNRKPYELSHGDDETLIPLPQEIKKKYMKDLINLLNKHQRGISLECDLSTSKIKTSSYNLTWK